MPNDLETSGKSFLSALEEKVKNFINKIRIPPLLSFFITKDGKINPTLEESLQDASPKEENWVRMGLNTKVFGSVPVWVILLLPIVMVAVRYGSEALQFFITIISQFVMLIPLFAIGYFIWKSWKK